jgi:hypothetical protein
MSQVAGATEKEISPDMKCPFVKVLWNYSLTGHEKRKWSDVPVHLYSSPVLATECTCATGSLWTGKLRLISDTYPEQFELT